VPPGVCLGTGAVAAKLNASNMAIPNCKTTNPDRTPPTQTEQVPSHAPNRTIWASTNLRPAGNQPANIRRSGSTSHSGKAAHRSPSVTATGRALSRSVRQCSGNPSRPCFAGPPDGVRGAGEELTVPAEVGCRHKPGHWRTGCPGQPSRRVLGHLPTGRRPDMARWAWLAVTGALASPGRPHTSDG
jgi:hypothetical protein